MEYKNCPNCYNNLKGFLKTDYIITGEKMVSFLNSYRDEKSPAYCSNCVGQVYAGIVTELRAEKASLMDTVNTNLDFIPIITAHNPQKWDYTAINMVSAQSVSGTGIISEIASSWTDLLGGQSGSLQDKLSNGESLCRNQLRYKAAMLGGDAVIAADVDYAEVGGGKGMLMVCMAGTAIKLNNANEVLPNNKEGLSTLTEAIERLNQLMQVDIPSL